MEGHNPGDEACDEYSEPIPNVVPFSGASDFRSNFYPCELKPFGFTHRSFEHAFQYVKAVRSGDIPRANDIQSEPTALDAKRIGKTISASKSFEDSKLELMPVII